VGRLLVPGPTLILVATLGTRALADDTDDGLSPDSLTADRRRPIAGWTAETSEK
jgi:hypothetical protein